MRDTRLVDFTKLEDDEDVEDESNEVTRLVKIYLKVRPRQMV